MSLNEKEYKSINEIIDILKQRNLNFSYPIRAKRLLTENNYFFIKGYNYLFLDKHAIDVRYKDRVDFEDLFRLYSFDKDIKTLIFRYLLDIEQKIKATLSNYISEKYGIRENDYLKKGNFNLNSPFLDKVIKNIHEQMKTYGEKNGAVKYYRTKYNYVPLWVLTKCLTMGAIRDLYSIMKTDDQDRIAKIILTRDIKRKRVATLKNIIALLVDVRNMCAHDEIIINFEHRRIDISELPELAHFKLLKNNNGDVIQGRKDFLALLISMKYLTHKNVYNKFIQKLESKIKKFVINTPCITEQELLSYMHLPFDYYKLKQI